MATVTSDRDVHHDHNLPCIEAIPREDLTSVAILPFVGLTFNSISMVLCRHNIKTIGPLPRMVAMLFWLIRDDSSLKTLGIPL